MIKSLCNEDCNNCEAVENPQVALLLNVLALRFGEEVLQIANQICPNMTVCPDCSMDDFCHRRKYLGMWAVGSIWNTKVSQARCKIVKAAKAFFKNYQLEKERNLQ